LYEQKPIGHIPPLPVLKRMLTLAFGDPKGIQKVGIQIHIFEKKGDLFKVQKQNEFQVYLNPFHAQTNKQTNQPCLLSMARWAY
jgi:hypothetical protein